jgi:lipoprotein Spr
MRLLVGFIGVLFIANFAFSIPLDSLEIKKPKTRFEILKEFYWNKFQIDLNDSENDIELYAFIKRWYHTRYMYGGKSKWGTDCSGFTGLLCDSLYGFDLPRTAYDQYNPRFHVNKSDLKEGDLVFFKIGWNQRISHVGLYLGNHKFVHAAILGGVIISDLREPYYARWYYAASRNIEYLKNLKSYGKKFKKIAIEIFNQWQIHHNQ